MKSYFLISLVLPTLLSSGDAKGEIAPLINNDLDFSKAEELLERQNDKIFAILERDKEGILEGVTSISAQNLKEIKSEIGSFLSEKFDLPTDVFEQDSQSAEKPIFSSLPNLRDNEIAVILTNDEPYSIEDPIYSKTRSLLENHNYKIAAILRRNKEEILQRLTKISSENLKNLKSEIGSLLFKKFELATGTFSPPLQTDALVQNTSPSSPSTNSNAPSPDTNVPMPQKVKKNERNGIAVNLDLLGWIAYEDGLEFALTGVPNTANNGPPSSQGQMYRPDFQLSPGVRLEAAYQNSSWGLDARWTYLPSHAHRNVFSEPAGVEAGEQDMDLWAVWNGIGAGFGAVNYANAQWRLNYNSVELTTNIALRPLDKMVIKPSFGFLCACINQTYHISYGANANEDQGFFEIENDFNGGGLRGAIDMAWDVNRYFGFHARTGGGLVFGRFFLHSLYNATFDPTLLFGSPYLNVADCPWSMKPEFDFCVGVRGSISFPKLCSELKFAAAWDLLLWLDQNQMQKFYGTDINIDGDFVQPYRGRFNTQHGDLFFQGFTVSVGWEEFF